MNNRNNRNRSQRGGGYNSLWGLNQPNFHDNSCPSYYNNHYGFSETQLRPFHSGHGTVGDGYGKGVNQGQAHYSLPMSGAGRRAPLNESSNASDWSDTSSEWSDIDSNEWSESSQSGGGQCDCGADCNCDCGCAKTGVCQCDANCPCDCGCGEGSQSGGARCDCANCDCDCDCECDEAGCQCGEDCPCDCDCGKESQEGGSHTGDHGLPWKWFNPSTPINTQAVNANNPLITKVGPSGNSPTFDSTNLVGGRRRNQNQWSDSDSTSIDY